MRTLNDLPIAFENNARSQSVAILNEVLADTMTLRNLSKKHHWQMSGATFYQPRLPPDKHYEEQAELVDMIADRIIELGGISVAMAPDVSEIAKMPRPPKGRDDMPSQLARILEAHQLILRQAHEGGSKADESDDDGTNDMLMSNVIWTNEPQVWFVAEHLVTTQLEA